MKNYRIGEKTFSLINALFMLLICATMLYPFLYLISVAISTENVPMTKIYLIPPEVTLNNIKQVLKNEYILYGFRNTIVRTILGTFLSVTFTVLGAYPLSKKYFPNRKFWMAFISVTMFFSAGLVPTYLWIKALGLRDTIWVLVLPGLVSAYNLIIARNFFMGLPESVEESARIDGANDWCILYKIIVPMSMPIIATLTLWIAVDQWNAWFDSMLYITDAKKQVLQVVVRRIVLEGSIDPTDGNPELQASANPEMLKAATTLVTTVPILVVYPFIQKYFVKGVMVGSVKG